VEVGMTQKSCTPRHGHNYEPEITIRLPKDFAASLSACHEAGREESVVRHGARAAGSGAQIPDQQALLKISTAQIDRLLRDRKEPIEVTRSRPYHSNDNAHVEQKNRTHIREFIGYEPSGTQN
jgi:hypothetical protein